MLQQINTPDKNIQLIQDFVNAALTKLQNAPLAGGVLLSRVTLTSGQDNLVQHTLGRMPTLYFNSIPNVSTTIWSPNTASLNGSNSDSTRINLRCSTTCIVNIWIN